MHREEAVVSRDPFFSRMPKPPSHARETRSACPRLRAMRTAARPCPAAQPVRALLHAHPRTPRTAMRMHPLYRLRRTRHSPHDSHPRTEPGQPHRAAKLIKGLPRCCTPNLRHHPTAPRRTAPERAADALSTPRTLPAARRRQPRAARPCLTEHPHAATTPPSCTPEPPSPPAMIPVASSSASHFVPG